MKGLVKLLELTDDLQVRILLLESKNAKETLDIVFDNFDLLNSTGNLAVVLEELFSVEELKDATILTSGDIMLAMMKNSSRQHEGK